MLAACIFDLDGVLTDTAKFHYLAWKEVAKSFNYNLTEEDNEKLKGVSRLDSLFLILEWAEESLTPLQIDTLLDKKNEHYLELIQHMSTTDVFDGVLELFESLKKNKVKIALGSSSKNAMTILNRLEINHWFDAISDGNNVVKSKPDAEVFLYAAEKMNVNPTECLVFEDAPAGVDAALNANMHCIGIGDPGILVNAQICMPNLKELNYNKLIAFSQLNF